MTLSPAERPPTGWGGSAFVTCHTAFDPHSPEYGLHGIQGLAWMCSPIGLLLVWPGRSG